MRQIGLVLRALSGSRNLSLSFDGSDALKGLEDQSGSHGMNVFLMISSRQRDGQQGRRASRTQLQKGRQGPCRGTGTDPADYLLHRILYQRTSDSSLSGPVSGLSGWAFGGVEWRLGDW